MQEVSQEKEVALARLTAIVDRLFSNNILYPNKLDKEQMIQHLGNLFGKFSTEELKDIDDGDLTNRIDSILVLNAVTGTLNDLTPDQMEIFDAAVEER